MIINKIRKNSFIDFFISLGMKFFRVVPWCTISLVFAALFSQLFLLVAFLFPLKVLFLIKSPSSIDTLSFYGIEIGSGTLIILLVIASAGFYIFHSLLEKYIAVFTERAALQLINETKKLNVFENQNEIAQDAYKRYSVALASSIFCLLGILIITLVYPKLALVLLSLAMMMFAGLAFFSWISAAFYHLLLKNFLTVFSVCVTLEFFFGFIFIIFDYYYGFSSDIILAVISLLLMRQMMSRSLSLVKELIKLSNRRNKITALFFYKRNPMVGLLQKDKNFWSCIEPQNRDKWIKEVLHTLLNISANHIETKWYIDSSPGIISFEIIVKGFGDQLSKKYFLKIFNKSARMQALHEATLLLEPTADTLPAPLFLGATKIGEYPCHLFEWDEINRNILNEMDSKSVEALKNLILYRPSDSLIERYKRSKSLLYDRLKLEMLEHLSYLISNPLHFEQLEFLKNNFNAILFRLKTIPLQIINPRVVLENFYLSLTGDVKITQWGQWSIEPIGASWPIKYLKINILIDTIEFVREKDPKLLKKIHNDDIKLAAYLYHFERFYLKQDYEQALELLSDILSCCSSIIKSENISD